MTKDEALALALEALERTKDLMPIKGGGMYEKVRTAITAIKQAQQAQEPVKVGTVLTSARDQAIFEAGVKAGKQAQEPVKMITPYITQEHFDRAFPDTAPKQSAPNQG